MSAADNVQRRGRGPEPMPTHAEKRWVPYGADEMYALIADVGRYPEFLPWCAAARVRRTEPLPDGSGEVMDADLVVSFKVYRERFTSRVTLRPEARAIDVEYLDGPFRYLKNHWRFIPMDEGSEVDFFVDFEFRSAVLQKLIGLVFHEAMLRIVRAFERRAETLYGVRTTA
jgi:coenzyme Q-binding protein COQ10